MTAAPESMPLAPDAPITPPPAAPSNPADLIPAILNTVTQMVVQSQVTTRKESLAWTLNHLAQVIRQTERAQIQGADATLAHYSDATAATLEHAATYLHDHDLGAIGTDAQRVAREHPALVVGALLGMGVLLGRLMRNVAPPAA
jgi:kynurenine formamidase